MNGRALLAWNIRQKRVERGFSQERLAADSGIDRAYLGELEREEGNATVDLLDRLADAMDISIADLFERPPAGARRPKPLRQGRPRRRGKEKDH